MGWDVLLESGLKRSTTNIQVGTACTWLQTCAQVHDFFMREKSKLFAASDTRRGHRNGERSVMSDALRES